MEINIGKLGISITWGKNGVDIIKDIHPNDWDESYTKEFAMKVIASAPDKNKIGYIRTLRAMTTYYVTKPGERWGLMENKEWVERNIDYL